MSVSVINCDMLRQKKEKYKRVSGNARKHAKYERVSGNARKHVKYERVSWNAQKNVKIQRKWRERHEAWYCRIAECRKEYLI